MPMLTVRLGLVATVVLLAAQTVPVAAEGSRWFLDSCPPGSAEGAQRKKAAVLAATPDSEFYVPHPYPQSDAEVIANLEYQFFRLLDPKRLRADPRDVRGIVELLRKKRVRFEILEVTDWTPSRCRLGGGQVDFLHVVRVLSSRRGEELTRVVLDDNGLLATFTTRPEDPSMRPPPAAFPSIAYLREKNAAAAGGTDFQHVAIAGPSLYSPEVQPAIAFRKNGRALIAMSDGRLFQVDNERPGVAGTRSLEFVREGPQREAVIAALRPGEHLVTVGGFGLAVAMPLESEADAP